MDNSRRLELPTYPQANNKYLFFNLKTTEDYILILLICGLDKGSTSLLKISRRQFFEVLKNYRNDPEKFSLEYKRTHPPRQLSKALDKKIEMELKKEKQLIDDKDTPIRRYNYSYVKTRLEEKHNVKVSLSSIIRRAKKKGFIKISSPEKTTIEKY